VTIVLTILMVFLNGVAFIGGPSTVTLFKCVFFTFGGFAVFWGVFIQMGPTILALRQRSKGMLTSEELAMEMAELSEEQLISKFPRVFDMSEKQVRQLFPSQIAMFPEGFQWSVEALNAARLELQRRNIPVPKVEFQPARFMELQENRNLKQIFKWCLMNACFSVPTSFLVVHHLSGVVIRGGGIFSLATIFVQTITPLAAILSTLGLVVIPCVLLAQYAIFRKRRRKLSALSEAIAKGNDYAVARFS
jgi:hypothetical protein